MSEPSHREGALAGWGETLLTLLLPFFAIAYIWGTTQVTEPPRNILVGPRTFPLLIGWMMLGVSVVLVWRRLRWLAARRAAAKQHVTAALVPLEDEDAAVSDWAGVWWTLGSLLALIVLLERLGFLLSLTLFLSGLSTVFTPRRWVINLVTALGFSFAFYFVFTEILGIPLPNGILEPLF